MKKLLKILLILVLTFAFSNSLLSNSSARNSNEKINPYNPETSVFSVNTKELRETDFNFHEDFMVNTLMKETSNEFYSDTLPKTAFSNFSLLSTGNLSIVNNDAEIKIYPNPASEKIFVQFTGWSGEKEIKLHDITGRSVFTLKSADNNHEIDITNLPRGIYLISVKNAAEYIVKKIKIQ